MKYKLKEEELKILYEIFKKQKKLDWVSKTDNNVIISGNNIQEVIELLGDCIFEYGISNDEINKEGEKLDNIITVLLNMQLSNKE